ncbi:MAG: penicillin-insensitive murein endopeptidase [Myxococcales bacterium]|nr:penicillin-insensitive murein endopeptidase [Myxococcales bacterium]
MRTNRSPAAIATLAAAALLVPGSVWAVIATTEANRAAQLDAASARAQTTVATAVSSAFAAAAYDREAAAQAREAAAGIAGFVAAETSAIGERVGPLSSRRVELGDATSVAAIQAKWGTEPERLQQLNPDVDLNALQPDQELVVWRYDPARPAQSVGKPSRGRLANGVPMPEGEFWNVGRPENAWGTEPTILGLVEGLTHVGRELPGGGTPTIADISRRNGGSLRPHRSHRSGRDADVTYFRTDPTLTMAWGHVSASALDVQRQWALFRYWLDSDAIDYIFIDTRLKRAIRDYVASTGVDAETLARVFGGNGREGVLRYERGHSDHFHVRFRCAEGDAACH